MPELKIYIDATEVEMSQLDESPATISYDLEDEKNFQSKAAATAFDVKMPATLANDRLFNTFRNPGVLDLSPGNRYRRARTAGIIVDGVPVLIGKALLKSGSTTNRPEEYVANFYGDNGDWLVDMQDLTIYDCLPTNTHVFDRTGSVIGGTYKPGIEDTWLYDGTNGNQSWLYAPVRYAQAFETNDSDIPLTQMRPALFVYWILQRAFAKYGYQISSQFMDSPVFRGIVMPWTWGNFLGINSKLADMLKFRATGQNGLAGPDYFSTSQSGTGTSGPVNAGIFPGTLGGGVGDTFSLNNTLSNGGYDNNANYSYNDAIGEWMWTYRAVPGGISFGMITAFFGVSASGEAGASSNSNASIYCDVYKNGAIVQTQQLFNATSTGPSSSPSDADDNRVFNFSVANLVVGDTVSIRFRYTYKKSFFGQTSNSLNAWNTSSGTTKKTTFELFRIQVQPGSIVDWSYFEQFKKYKFLDFLRGILDTFDIIPKTDPLTRTVVMEPSHPTSVGTHNFTGYFKPNRLDWSSKRDLAQPNETQSYDELQRDYIFSFLNDPSDGGIQVLTSRFSITPAGGKYRFGERVKEGTQTFENRFFSGVTHLKMTQWSGLAGGQGRTPQIIAIVPERLSDTSSTDSEDEFAPKLAFYKGYINGMATDGVGVFQMGGTVYPGYPFMFAVNYFPGGEDDIILTYCDQLINGVVGPGLMRRFFLQRLAIMDNGVQYQPWIRLNNNDAANWFHRERMAIDGNLYLLTNIDRWDPVKQLSAKCTFWKFTPTEQKHRDQLYPSAASINGTLSPVPAPDLAYQQMFILPTDLPTYGQ